MATPFMLNIRDLHIHVEPKVCLNGSDQATYTEIIDKQSKRIWKGELMAVRTYQALVIDLNDHTLDPNVRKLFIEDKTSCAICLQEPESDAQNLHVHTKARWSWAFCHNTNKKPVDILCEECFRMYVKNATTCPSCRASFFQTVNPQLLPDLATFFHTPLEQVRQIQDLHFLNQVFTLRREIRSFLQNTKLTLRELSQIPRPSEVVNNRQKLQTIERLIKHHEYAWNDIKELERQRINLTTLLPANEQQHVRNERNPLNRRTAPAHLHTETARHGHLAQHPAYRRAREAHRHPRQGPAQAIGMPSLDLF